MRLVKGGNSLNTKLKRLVEKHDNMAFAVAWASSSSGAYQAILANRGKIRKVVIGTHFYQTHPDVLDDFVNFDRCHFVLQPQGVFHPKVFLFWSNNSWDLLIGSANLTKGALTKNTELLLHVTAKDTDVELRSQAECIILEYWDQGEVVTSSKAGKYRELWKTKQKALRRLSGTYIPGSKGKAPIETNIMPLPWVEFLRLVRADPYHGFSGRCELLSLVREYFDTHASFRDMELSARKTISGLPNGENDHWAWFGSMRGNGYYHQAINQNNLHIAAALDLIPLRGIVSHDDYQAYIEEFVRAFPNGRHGISTASRLLALKRPDQFVCLDAKNKSQLCADFGIQQTGLDYQRYWDDVVCRIMDSAWWNSPKPLEAEAGQVWLGRAAMLDAIFYRP